MGQPLLSFYSLFKKVVGTMVVNFARCMLVWSCGSLI